MQSASASLSRHNELAERFLRLGQTRGELPVFAIEHGLDESALKDLRKIVSQQLEETPQLSEAVWSWSYLPLVVIATEVGYRYRGTGTDFWPVLSQELNVETDYAFRIRLSRLFELGHGRFRLARPGNSPWENHFPHISWPIGNSVTPIEIQPQLADALRHAVRTGIPMDDADRLLDHIKDIAAGHASPRFENWLLKSDLAIEVMRRLLAPETEGWLSKDFLTRIDRDIRKDWGALRALTEARRTGARRAARLAQVEPSLFALALKNGAPKQLIIRGPALPVQLRDEVIAALRIHGDRIRAVHGIQAISLGSFLAGGEIALNGIFPFPSSPLRRGDAMDVGEGVAGEVLDRLQPREPEFFAVDPDGRMAHAIFPDGRILPESGIIQILPADDNGVFETRTLDTSTPSDTKFLRSRGFVIADRIPSLQLLGLPATGYSNRFLSGFPVLVSQRGVADTEYLLNDSVASGEPLHIGGVDWIALEPGVGPHQIEPADGRGTDRLKFEVIEPPSVEPANVTLLPANANVSDLETGRLDIRLTAPLALEDVPVRITAISPNGPTRVSEGVIDRLPAKLAGRSPILNVIRKWLVENRVNESGLRLSVEPEGLQESLFWLPPVRSDIRYDGETGQWKRNGEDGNPLPSIIASVAEPLLDSGDHDPEGIRLVLPDAPDHEALTSGMILSGSDSTYLRLGEDIKISLPALLREPVSNQNGVGLIELARANIAWQLAEAKNLLGNWRRWTVVKETEDALVEQLCGTRWRELETGINPLLLSPHGALFYCAEEFGLVSGESLPPIKSASDREFLRERIIVRLRETVPDIPEALLQWNDDLAGNLDIAVIDAYNEDLKPKLETSGIEAFEAVDMSRQAETWRQALEHSRRLPQLPMFSPFILPNERWSALVRPFYGELTEDDLVDLLDATHVDAFRQPGRRLLGRSELRTMLQLWLSPKAMVEAEGWRDILAKALSDVRTSRAVRYVALRRIHAHEILPNGSAG